MRFTKQELIELLEKTQGASLDCGDNSCFFATDKGGMRTNGGCRCLRDISFEVRQYVKRTYLKPQTIQNLVESVIGLSEALEEISKLSNRNHTSILTPEAILAKEALEKGGVK